MPRPDLERIELDLSKLNSPDAYYLAELFLKEHDSLLAPLMGLYIRISVVIIIGLVISLFFAPYPASFVVLLILLTANLTLHYSTKNKISSYTRSLPQLLILNSVARDLLKKSTYRSRKQCMGPTELDANAAESNL